VIDVNDGGVALRVILKARKMTPDASIETTFIMGPVEMMLWEQSGKRTLQDQKELASSKRDQRKRTYDNQLGIPNRSMPALREIRESQIERTFNQSIIPFTQTHGKLKQLHNDDRSDQESFWHDRNEHL
jgi:hypothetical protein